MHSISTRSKALAAGVFLSLLLTQGTAWALGSGCIGCATSPPSVAAPRPHVEARSLLRAAPVAIPVTVEVPEPRVARSDVSHGPSTNPYVSPWGCEAETAQDTYYIYWGKYQFDRQTWEAHGGNPATYGSASEAEQDAVAARVSYDAWPNC